MKFDRILMKTAMQQTTAQMIVAADDNTGGRVWNALEKAINEIKENSTIEFDGGKLTFVSRDSGKTRIVTKFGCVANACDCGNGISYHSALYAILARYTALETERRAEVDAAIVASITKRNDSGTPYFPAKLYAERPSETVGKVRI